MAKCGFCGHVGTTSETISPKHAHYKQTAISCSFCGAILGVTGFYDEGALLKGQEEEIAKLARKVDQLVATVNQLSQLVQQRR